MKLYESFDDREKAYFSHFDAHPHNDKVNPDTVVDLFSELHPRRLQLSSVLFEAR